MARPHARLAPALPLLLLLPACGGGPSEPLLVYVNAEQGVSVRYPASWKTEQAEQEGIWYRYFLGPPTGPQRKPAVSATLLAGPLEVPLEDYAQAYLGGNPVVSESQVSRPGATSGRSYAFRSSDGATRYSLLLLKDDGRVYGLYAQGEREPFERHAALVEQMNESLTLEKPELYPVERSQEFGYSLRVPPSWRSTRSLSGGGRLLRQLTSPPLSATKDGTVHASLTLSVEPLEGDAGVESFYNAKMDRLGDAFQVLDHEPWKDGYADYVSFETPMSASRAKRFYRAAGGRGYSLVFEAREDVFHRVSRWCDVIAETLKLGAEVE